MYCGNYNIKTNYTLDVFKHISNAYNKMNFTLSFPKFICEKLTVGRKIDNNFVGASFFSQDHYLKLIIKLLS